MGLDFAAALCYHLSFLLAEKKNPAITTNMEKMSLKYVRPQTCCPTM